MLSLPIVYYGRRGLEADVFQSYMRLSGYPVQMVPIENGSLPEAINCASSVAVISLDRPLDQILVLAQSIEKQAQGCVQIFILSDPESAVPGGPGVEVIIRPFHLSEVIKRIQRLHRGL